METKHPLTEWRNVGENPYALTFSPDGNQLIVSTYTGDFDLEFQRGKTNFGLASFTIWIYNTDPNTTILRCAYKDTKQVEIKENYHCCSTC